MNFIGVLIMKYKKCLLEIKKLIRNTGRSNLIQISEIDEIFVKYGINMKELEENNGN